MAFNSPIKETKAEVIFVRGTTKWASIIEPNQFGNFSVQLTPNKEDLEKYINTLEAMRDSAAKEVEEAGKKIAGLADVVKEDDEGSIYIHAQLKQEGFEGKENSIQIFDVQGREIENFDKLIGNGSEVVAKIYVKPYYMNNNKMVGISTKFYALQLVNLIEFGKSTGFGNLSDNKFDDTTTPEDGLDF